MICWSTKALCKGHREIRKGSTENLNGARGGHKETQCERTQGLQSFERYHNRERMNLEE
jgi:hypothetical protein